MRGAYRAPAIAVETGNGEELSMDQLPINATDLIVIGIVLLSGLLAFFRGFVRETLSVGAWVGAAFATLYGFKYVRPYARDLIGVDMIADIAAGAGLFILALVILSVVSSMLASTVKGSALNAVDRSLGFLFGLARGAILVCLAFLVLDWAVAEPERPDWIRNARTMPLIEQGAAVLIRLVPSEARSGAEAQAEATRRQAEQRLRQEMYDQLVNPPPKGPERKDDAQQPSSGYKTDERQTLDKLIQRNQ